MIGTRDKGYGGQVARENDVLAVVCAVLSAIGGGSRCPPTRWLGPACHRLGDKPIHLQRTLTALVSSFIALIPIQRDKHFHRTGRVLPKWPVQAM